MGEGGEHHEESHRVALDRDVHRAIRVGRRAAVRVKGWERRNEENERAMAAHLMAKETLASCKRMFCV